MALKILTLQLEKLESTILLRLQVTKLFSLQQATFKLEYLSLAHLCATLQLIDPFTSYQKKKLL
jgi:hypothetical protein